MFNKKTVVVIGAGASQEADIPIGSELKTEIASLLNIQFNSLDKRESGDLRILDALREYVRQPDGQRGDINPYVNAGLTIRDAMPISMSIDNFIDIRNGDDKIELCAKLAIVRAILRAEKSSRLYVNTERRQERLDYTRLADTWFTSFAKLLTENCRMQDVPNRLKSIVLIVFNYDRCIEHFLYHSLQTAYGINAVEAADIVNGIEIYHPYGTVGYLPWQKSGESVDFGAEPQARQLLSLTAQIKTFTEGTDEASSQISAIRRSVMEAELLLFLGFAFQRQNLRLLTPDTISDSPAPYEYFATAKGMSQSDRNVVVSDLIKMKGSTQAASHLEDCTCAQLLGTYWRSLSLSY